MFGSECICSNCGVTGYPARAAKGTLLGELSVWIIFIFLAIFLTPIVLIVPLFYSVWRLFDRQKVCRQCKAPNPIPVNTPRGRKLREEFFPGKN